MCASLKSDQRGGSNTNEVSTESYSNENFSRQSHDRRLFRSVSQRDVGKRDRPVRDRQDAKPAGQLKSLRSGRPRIEEQGAAKPFGHRLVRVAEDADVRPFSFNKCPTFLGEFSAFIQDVSDRYPSPAQFDDGLRLEAAPLITQDVADILALLKAFLTRSRRKDCSGN